MVENNEKNLYLIDTYSLIFRSYYALPPLVNSSGFQTNAVYGVVKSLLKLLKDFEVQNICAVYDSMEETFRKKLTETYKANRAKAPEELIKQFPVIEEVIDLMGIPSKRIEGYEADDVIGSIAKKLSREFNKVVIVTGDKDLFQLIDDRILIFDPKKDQWFDSDAAFKKFGVPPAKMQDYLSLVGDSSDNIPGAPGIGPKTAVKLLEKYDSIDNLFRHSEELTPGQQKSLEKFSEFQELTRDLVKIRTDLDIATDIMDYRLNPADQEGLAEKFSQLEFHSLISQFHFASKDTALHFTDPGKFSESEITAFKIIGKNCLLMNDNNDFTLTDIKDLRFNDETTLYISYDIKEDLKVLMENGLPTPSNYYDVSVAHHVLKGGKRITSFSDLAEDFPLSEHFSFKNDPGVGAEVLEKAGHLKHLMGIYEKHCGFASFEEEMENVLKPIEFPLIPILASMEINGIKIDGEHFHRVKKRYRKTVNKLEREIIELAGEPFNVDSPKQLSGILFGKLGLPIIKKTKTGASTNSSVLHELINKSSDPDTVKLLKNVLSYREVNKILSTYLEGFVKHISPQTGHIHTTFLQAATSTGRLSSENPNLQNLPIKTETGSIMRSLFVPSKEGELLLSLDYSQIELRILAHLTEDPGLMNAFLNDKDIHSITASKILDIPLEKVGKSERSIGKTINFGIMYGMGPYHLSQDIGISIKEADQFIKAYYREYSGVKDFQDKIVSLGEETGYVSTFFGRKRYVPELLSKDHNVHSSGVRVAINAPIQGTASEIVKLAMIEISKTLPHEIRLLLQIHDELVFEGPMDIIKSEEEKIAKIMEDIVEFRVPLKVDFAHGTDLLEIH